MTARLDRAQATTTTATSQTNTDSTLTNKTTTNLDLEDEDTNSNKRKIQFTVGSKYQVHHIIGEGAYGVVASAIHRSTGTKVAIKKISPFDHSMFALRTLRELKLLRYFAELNVCENIIMMHDVVRPKSFETFSEVYIIQVGLRMHFVGLSFAHSLIYGGRFDQELMETDLHRVIRTQKLSDDHIQYFAYQTFRALKGWFPLLLVFCDVDTKIDCLYYFEMSLSIAALHSADVIHRDLKPSNLLLNSNCDLKVCDFGLARSTRTAERTDDGIGFMTEYVATRWYRAPEIMLTFKQYTKAIDVWSVGCIIGEMISGKPLFPGRDYHDQLSKILDVTGSPTLEEFQSIGSKRSRDYLKSLSLREKVHFSFVYPEASVEAVDLLERCLTFDPKKRITVEQALTHPYLAAYHDPDDEPSVAALDPTFFDFDMQKETMGRNQLKRLLYEEVYRFQVTCDRCLGVHDVAGDLEKQELGPVRNAIMSLTDKEQVELLSQPLTLPCGLVLPNRLVKAAMEEILGTTQHDPSRRHFRLYTEWSKANWGMVITGNVMVDSRYIGSPVDVCVPFESSPRYNESIQAYQHWYQAATKHSQTPTIIQLCHSGRQSMRASGRGLFEPSVAPSAVGVKVRPGIGGQLLGKIMFGTPKSLTVEEIQDVVHRFVQGAKVAKQTGFDGVQLHCAHGYLLAQFLSPTINLRTDEYGGAPKKRMRIVLDIVSAIRKELPVSSGFCLGIKLNSSDYVKGGLTEEDALDNIKWLCEHGGLDFIEVSGGTYENPQMLQEDHETQSSMTRKSSSSSTTNKREAFFLNFASSAIKLVQQLDNSKSPTSKPFIMVTGGFRTRQGMSEALSTKSTNLIGLGRPACANPLLPLTLLDQNVPSSLARSPKYSHKSGWIRYIPIPLIGPGISTIFHTLLIAQISRGQQPTYEMTFLNGIWNIWILKGIQSLGWWMIVSLFLGIVGMGWKLAQ
ncbi:mitogen activated protein kinase [Microbotryomycetes sp. JL221]|nr:mitogen activated protein kinase [Microbotryomycetes sp. JL221]